MGELLNFPPAGAPPAAADEDASCVCVHCGAFHIGRLQLADDAAAEAPACKACGEPTLRLTTREALIVAAVYCAAETMAVAAVERAAERKS